MAGIDKVEIAQMIDDMGKALFFPAVPRIVYVDAVYTDNIFPYFKDWTSARAALLALDPVPDVTHPCWAIRFSESDGTQISIGGDTKESLEAIGIILRDGMNGATGVSAYVYIAYATDASGTGFTMTFNSGIEYIAIKTTTTPIASPQASDFTGLWKRYVGEQGVPGAAGAGAITTYTPISPTLNTVYHNTSSTHKTLILQFIIVAQIDDYAQVYVYADPTSDPMQNGYIIGQAGLDNSFGNSVSIIGSYATITPLIPAGWYWAIQDQTGNGAISISQCFEVT